MTTQLSVNRSSLSMSALVIGSTAVNSGIWLAAGGLGRPVEQWSRNYAVGRDFEGAVQTDARREQTAIALSVYVSGTSTANVEANYETLSEAFGQFSFPLSVTVDGYTRVWPADCADLTPGDYVSGYVDNFLMLVAINVPVYPIAS